MKNFIRCSAMVMAFGSSVAMAAVKVDPALQRLLNSPQESERNVVVVLEHRNLGSTGRHETILNRYGVQKALMANAELSQRRTMDFLKNLAHQESQGRVQYKRYWLSNTVIVYAPVRVQRQLIQNDDIAVARPMHDIRLIQPQVNRNLTNEPAAFTYGLQKLRIPELRSKVSTADGRGVRVGILDTGIDAMHPDLKGKMLVFRDFVNNKTTPYDDHGHGTHVAGTIAGGNASGTSIGVAPAASLIIAKTFTAGGGGSEDKILDAMQWITDPDGNPSTDDAPQIVSNSWGYKNASGDPADSSLCRAVDAWVKLSILPVFAAGNSGASAGTVNQPGACPSAFAVGATNSSDEIARFSSRGPAKWSTGTLIKPEVSAPGVNVLSAAPGGRYVEMSGTSMATPHVAGLAALVIQGRRQLRTEDVAKVIMGSALDLGTPGQDNDFGFGRVDALNALGAAFSERR